MVVRHYRQDFQWLGYATDPAQLLPLERRAMLGRGGAGCLVVWHMAPLLVVGCLKTVVGW